MTDFCYTSVPGKVKTLFSKIRQVGVPAKVTNQWLKTLGFTSSNDSTLIRVLKQVDFVDGSQIPTARWTQYRGADHKVVLAQAIREGYSELFSVYPDANTRSQADLDHVFSTSTSGGKEVVAKTIRTFKSLVELADFDSVQDSPPVSVAAGAVAAGGSTGLPPTSAQRSHPSLHIDIQVHISPDVSVEQIDKIFESMAKHLYGEPKTEK